MVGSGSKSKVELIKFASRLYVGCEKRQGVKVGPRYPGL